MLVFAAPGGRQTTLTKLGGGVGGSDLKSGKSRNYLQRLVSLKANFSVFAEIIWDYCGVVAAVVW